jgi:hypothetical protein
MLSTQKSRMSFNEKSFNEKLRIRDAGSAAAV